jgi:serine/threonine-protein kinase ULK/ATG1
MIGQGVNTAATALGRGSQRTRRPDIPRTGMMNDAEEELLRSVEDLASKAFALFELGYERLEHWQALQRRDPALGLSGRTPPTANIQQLPNPYAPGSSARRKSSSSSMSANSDLLILRQQESAAGEAVVLYLKSLTFIVKAIYKIQAHRTEHGGEDTSPEINESESL